MYVKEKKNQQEYFLIYNTLTMSANSNNNKKILNETKKTNKVI